MTDPTTTDQRPIPVRRRLAGIGYAPLPTITQEDADAEPPASRTFAEPEAPTFSRGPARRPQPQVADPLLQWATGLQTKERSIYAGWLVEVGRHEDLDQAMDGAGFSRVTIKHGNGNLVNHWAIEVANVFVIADGVQSIGEMKSTEERYGIAFAWRARQDGRPQSQLRCRVFLQELLAVGYAEPLLLTVKGTLTGDLIDALTRQYAVLDAIDAFRAQDGKPPLNPPFYACSVPLAAGQEVTRGNGSATKEITPMAARIPEPVTKAYILDHWAKRPWVEVIEGLAEATIAWSETMSRLIAAGEEQAGEGE